MRSAGMYQDGPVTGLPSGGVRVSLAWPQLLRAQLRGLLPGLRLESLPDNSEPSWTTAVRLHWTGAHPVLHGTPAVVGRRQHGQQAREHRAARAVNRHD